MPEIRPYRMMKISVSLFRTATTNALSKEIINYEW